MEVTSQMTKNNETFYPVLPLRGLLVFPEMVLHVDVGRERSISALNEAMVRAEKVFLVAQKDMAVERPTAEDLYNVGILAFIKQMVKLPNGTIRVLVEGLERATWDEYKEQELYDEVTVTAFEVSEDKDLEEIALMRTLVHSFEKYSKSSKSVSEETYKSVSRSGRTRTSCGYYCFPLTFENFR